MYPSKQSCKQPNHRRDINKNRAEINKRKRRIFALSSVYSLSTIRGSSSSLNFLSTSLTILSHLVAFQKCTIQTFGSSSVSSSIVLVNFMCYHNQDDVSGSTTAIPFTTLGSSGIPGFQKPVYLRFGSTPGGIRGFQPLVSTFSNSLARRTLPF